MAKGLGSTFQSAAMAPLDQAERYLAAGKVESALDAFAQESLIGAVRRGVEAVAKATGAGAMDVYGHLPMDELDAHVARIDSHRRAVSNVWVERATDDWRTAVTTRGSDPVSRLEALAHASIEDEGLGREVSRLAVELEAWRNAIAECRGALLKIPELKRALRRRARTRQILLFVLLGIFAVGAIGYKRLHSARARIDARLAAECEVDKIATSDLQLASEEQQEQVREARWACQRKREKERLAEEKRRATEEAARRAKEARAAMLKRCIAFGERFAAKQLDDSDKALAGAGAEVLERLAAGQLLPSDVSADLGALPCGDAPAGKLVRERLTTSIVALGPLWLRTQTLPLATRQMMIAQRSAVTEAHWVVFGAQLEQAAEVAVLGGQPETIARYAELCRFKTKLKIEQGGTCEAVLELEQKQKGE